MLVMVRYGSFLYEWIFQRASIGFSSISGRKCRGIVSWDCWRDEVMGVGFKLSIFVRMSQVHFFIESYRDSFSWRASSILGRTNGGERSSVHGAFLLLFERFESALKIRILRILEQFSFCAAISNAQNFYAARGVNWCGAPSNFHFGEVTYANLPADLSLHLLRVCTGTLLLVNYTSSVSYVPYDDLLREN